MKIINKARGTGKTWDLIKEASEKYGIILTPNKNNTRRIKEKAYWMQDNGFIKRVPVVKTYERGMIINTECYIDELDLFLTSVLGIKIDKATMTGEITDDTNRNTPSQREEFLESALEASLETNRKLLQLISSDKKERQSKASTLTINVGVDISSSNDLLSRLVKEINKTNRNRVFY